MFQTGQKSFKFKSRPLSVSFRLSVKTKLNVRGHFIFPEKTLKPPRPETVWSGFKHPECKTPRGALAPVWAYSNSSEEVPSPLFAPKNFFKSPGEPDDGHAPLGVRGRRLVCHDLYRRLHHEALVQGAVRIVQGRRPRISETILLLLFV